MTRTEKAYKHITEQIQQKRDQAIALVTRLYEADGDTLTEEERTQRRVAHKIAELWVQGAKHGVPALKTQIRKNKTKSYRWDTPEDKQIRQAATVKVEADLNHIIEEATNH